MDDSDNLKKIIEQAEEAFDNGDWEEATDLYTKAYTMQPSFLTNQGLAASLLNLKKADEAEAVILDYFNYYLSDPNAAGLVEDIIIENNDYLLANQVLNFYENNPLSTIDEEFIIDFKKRVKLSEDRHKRSFGPRMKEIKQKILSIVTQTSVEQIELMRDLREFDKANYLECAKILLGNPLLHPLLKSETLENLFKLGVDEDVNVSFYGENRTCNPSRLKPIMSTDIYIKLCDELEKILKDSSNEIQLENMRGELSLYAAMVYPFGDEIIKSPILWTKVFLVRYGLIDESEIEDNSETEEVKKWVERIDSLINTFQQ